MRENYFAAYVQFGVVLGVKLQIHISVINAIILNTGFISTKTKLQHDAKHGLVVTTFHYSFSKLKSTAHVKRMDVLILNFRERIMLVHINYYRREEENIKFICLLMELRVQLSLLDTWYVRGKP